jgi:SAM-dependent methyltransferase
MHDTALYSGLAFSQIYGENSKIVVDIGGKNIMGSLRNFFTERGMKYICVDLEEHESVDIVVKPGEPLPFDNGSIDIIVSTSCFEHDPCFWLTFKEMARITKLGGYIYVNAPSNGTYHTFPGDNWRFYSDAGQALAYWSGYQNSNETVYPVKVIETFHILPLTDEWIDFVCVWQRVNEKETEIITSNLITDSIGKLENLLNNRNIKTIKKFRNNSKSS